MNETAQLEIDNLLCLLKEQGIIATATYCICKGEIVSVEIKFESYTK